MVLTFVWFSVSSLVRLGCPTALYSWCMRVILSAPRCVFNWYSIGALCRGRAHACDNLVGKYIFRVLYSSLFSYCLSALCIWVTVCNCSLFTVHYSLFTIVYLKRVYLVSVNCTTHGKYISPLDYHTHVPYPYTGHQSNA